MNEKRFSEAITEVNDKYYEEAAQYKRKRKQPVWDRRAAIAACLCLVLGAVFVIPALTRTVPNDEVQTNTVPDYPAMIMVDNRLYKDSGEILDIPVSAREDGKITSSCDTMPSENNQSNFGTGYSYQYGESGSIYVLLKEGWHVFRLSGSESINMDNLSEQEKMALDPNYNAN